MSVNGVLTRSVADTALFHDVASGAIATDADSAPAPAVPFAQSAAADPGRLRIAYTSRIPTGVFTKVAADGLLALRETVDLLRSLGHEVTEADPPYGNDALPSVVARYLKGAHDDAAALAHPERLERRTKAMARIGGLIPSSLIDRSLASEAEITRRIGTLFEAHDVLLTPATATAPPRIGQLQGRGAVWTLNAVAGMVPFHGVWNLTGQPAASVPAGIGPDGLPRSVQIVGRPSDEATLLSLAAQIEASRPWAELRPPGFS
jgi:amidase